jgi:hypothetical protein
MKSRLFTNKSIGHGETVIVLSKTSNCTVYFHAFLNLKPKELYLLQFFKTFVEYPIL